jgi:Mg2+ and Co2+ transporter CorA
MEIHSSMIFSADVIVIVWMDHGRPLEQSPPGPWTSHIEARATPLPVLQHHPKMAFRTTTNRLNADANATAEFQQSTALLPLQYDSLIALVGLAHRAPQDPLAACIPLFAHAAFSEVQFLNLMESRIQNQIDLIVAEHPADALETLQYFTNVLNRHAQQLKESARVLCKLVERTRQGSNGTKVESVTTKVALNSGHSMRFPLETDRAANFSSPRSDGTFTPGGIIEDYDQLFVRCIDLSRTCTRGINLAMNKATIEESRRAIEQSTRVKRLTLLATLFIPLSFSSSLLGMNIDLLGQNSVKFWWFFVLCVPITLCASMVYLWDIQFLRRGWVRFWKGCRCSRRHMKAERYNKDPNHIV